jgi:hypothetical protein
VTKNSKLRTSTMFTVGLKGGMLRVAKVAERVLLKLGGRAPDCGRACPALGGCTLADHWHAGEPVRLAGSVRLPVALGCACGPPVSASTEGNRG